MARTGKIARLPLAIREELNERLRDNHSGTDILAWVNALPITQEILKAKFSGNPISDANLSEWRGGGFAEWLDDQEKVHKIQKLSELSLRLAKASGGNLSEGLLAIAAGKLQEALEAGVEIDIDEDGKETISGSPLDKLVKALTAVRGMELEAQKLEVKKVEVTQKGQALDLETRKFNHIRVKSFIEWMADEEAKKIANSDLATDTKLDALGQYLFGDAW
jgi:uncharacterized OsmC-like protein